MKKNFRRLAIWVMILFFMLTSCSTASNSGTPGGLTPTETSIPTATPTPIPTEAIVLAGNMDYFIGSNQPGELSINSPETDVDILLMDPDGNNAVQITNDEGKNTDPDFSPDGTKIVFVSQQRGGIVVINRDGSNPTLLLETKEALFPTWSPDGKYIIYLLKLISDESPNAYSLVLFRMDADGSNQIQLTEEFVAETKPAWSPDGRFIAFISHGDGIDKVFVMDRDGSNEIPVAQSTQEFNYLFSPVWSAEGNSVYYLETRLTGDHYTAQIIKIDLLGIAPPKTIFGGIRAIEFQATDKLSISPDGKRLVGGSTVMDSDGNHAVRLTNLLVMSNVDWFIPGIQTDAISVDHPLGLSTPSAENIQLELDLIKVCQGGVVPGAPAYNTEDPIHPVIATISKVTDQEWKRMEYPGNRLPLYDLSEVQLVACSRETYIVIENCYYRSETGNANRTIERGKMTVTTSVFEARSGVLVDQFDFSSGDPQPCPYQITEYENVSLAGSFYQDDWIYSHLDYLFYGENVTPNKPEISGTTPPFQPQTLFDLDYEDGYVGDWDNWSSTPLSIKREGNNLYLHFVSSGDVMYPGMWLTNVDLENWKNYAFESRVRLYDNGLALAFYGNNGDFYQAGLAYPDALFFSDFIQTRAESYQQFQSIPFVLKSNQWYLVRIEVYGDQLSLYVDDQLYLSAQRDTISSGGIGFIGDTSKKTEFDVDDVRVWKLK